jgi:two-component system, cell cycle response regulator DivK
MIGAYNWNGKVILVAEDEEINYLFLEEVIRRTGAKVLWAKNGKEAIEQYRSNKVDLILMDLKMPEMNGYEAMQQIKDTKGETKIIAQTAFAMSGEREEILEAGFDGYISKPIKIPDLLRLLEANFDQKA